MAIRTQVGVSCNRTRDRDRDSYWIYPPHALKHTLTHMHAHIYIRDCRIHERTTSSTLRVSCRKINNRKKKICKKWTCFTIHAWLFLQSMLHSPGKCRWNSQSCILMSFQYAVHHANQYGNIEWNQRCSLVPIQHFVNVRHAFEITFIWHFVCFDCWLFVNCTFGYDYSPQQIWICRAAVEHFRDSFFVR